MDIITLLKKALALGASDIHLSVGTSPVFRINGNLTRINPENETSSALSQADTLRALQTLMTTEQYETWKAKGELDFSYSLPGVGRFRVNAYRQRGCASLAIRPVPYVIPSLESLGISPAVAGMTAKKQGLILVAGPAGSGKSTTLAALINKINRERSCHIITIEDPIEYLHQHQKSVIDQREIGGDTYSMAGALKACLRQDPDVIMVSQIEDWDTIATALTAAETGHLVLASLHTSSVVQTIDWLIGVFPVNQQEQVKLQLASVLQGIVAQKLIPGTEGQVMASEILIATSAVRNLVREHKSHQLVTLMQTGGRWGMQTMDMSLKELVLAGRVSQETAEKYCNDRESFTKSIVQ